MADFNKDKCFEKKMYLPEKQLNVDAKRNELLMQAYYHELEKLPNEDNPQKHHKPYQCDIELR